MKLRRASLILGAVIFGFVVTAAEPPLLNLSRAKMAVREYHDSGRYIHDVAQVAGLATTWLEQRAARRSPDERLAVVFDVDETVLSNYPHMDERDFGYVPEEWVKWVEKAAAPALDPMREVYRKARALDIAVIFLTGRHAPAEEKGTLENLERAGMGEFERIIFQTADDTASTAAERKRLRRIRLEQEGWTIIASLGDQQSDIAGGHAERIFKLPNPYYEVP